MYISRITIKNFRLLLNTKLNLKKELCMMIGRNNTGKTSFLVMLEKFLKNESFEYNDFSTCLRSNIFDVDSDTDVHETSIKLLLELTYEKDDDLSNISEFILDLDVEKTKVNIGFECYINKEKLIDSLENNKSVDKEKYIKKYISNYLIKKVYIFESESDFLIANRDNLISKEIKDVKKIIDFDIIHAKRNVASSEESSRKKILSSLTTEYFNQNNESSPEKFEEINASILSMDEELKESYKKFFSGFLTNSRNFLGLDNLKVVSNLRSSELVRDSSEIIYGDDDNSLPEYLNGLGYMNILYLILSIEIKVSEFNKNRKNIKLLCIEEPEAHTHPHLQYIFAKKIKSLVKDVKDLQVIITTHSPHIVSDSDFSDIRYLSKEVEDNKENVVIVEFYNQLKEKYDSAKINEPKNAKELEKQFRFINQYLSIEAAELFFASKVIFIEGITERILLTYFIKEVDRENIIKEEKDIEKEDKQKKYIPLSSQGITIVETGSNAKAFKYFLELLKIKSLIITDIDTTKSQVKLDKNKVERTSYIACKVSDNPDSTSNPTIKDFLKAPSITTNSADHKEWLKKLIDGNLENEKNSKICYQLIDDNFYHARSFEDAFISENKEGIKDNIEDIDGLSSEDFITEISPYDLGQKLNRTKSSFASSLLYSVYNGTVDSWKVPKYIKEGLIWLQID